jgi:hypothetical protein
MKKYREDCTIYGLFPKDRFEDLRHCAMEFLDYYMSQLVDEPVAAPARLAKIQVFHNQFVDDIRTQDKAQGMISKMIGKAKARRIFYEITT